MDPLEYKDPRIQKSLLDLQQRLAGFVKFLINTTITRKGKPVSLNSLPWYLLVGPSNAGKSSLLHESDSHFVLRKQTHTTHNNTVNWWVTKHSCLIDVPGDYLFPTNSVKKSSWRSERESGRWRYLLHLIRYWRGNKGINGLLIALPLPELMQQMQKSEYTDLLHNLSMRIHELQAKFPFVTPCQLIITKCDLLPGFKEFFAEASEEDTENTWGISLPTLQKGDKRDNQFNRRFDAVLKRLNDQLLWRLHHERDPNAKLALKDFPLHVEKLRESILAFVNTINANSHSLSLDNIFFTSARQESAPSFTVNPSTSKELITTSEEALQIINTVKEESKAYFVKHLIDQTIVDPNVTKAPTYKRRTVIQSCIFGLCLAGLITGFMIASQDFNTSNDYLTALKNTVTQHELAIQSTKNAGDRLTLTLDLLNQLALEAKEQKPTAQSPLLRYLLPNDTSKPAQALYEKALSRLFIQELANYFSSYLITPVNRNIDDVYMGLKAYVMLGNPQNMQENSFIEILQSSLPRTLNDAQRQQLNAHITKALAQQWQPATLVPERLLTTRHYLDAMPAHKLALIILKSMNGNTKDQSINLGTNTQSSLFVSQNITDRIPSMFTAHEFLAIYSKEILNACTEALYGNWVLGNFQHVSNPNDIVALTQQVQSLYVSNYITMWETLLNNINLTNAANVSQIAVDLNQLISNKSPLLELLQTIHSNTFFDPIASNSSKLYSLGLLMEKNQESQRQLYQLFYGLSQLHQYIASVENAENKNKAAYDLLAIRMKNPNGPNAITQLKLIAMDKPEPIKSWLDDIADQTLNLLMLQASKYMDVSWQQSVAPLYEAKIANRYPFNKTALNEVDEASFSRFFGTHGVVLNFQHEFLMPFIDTSKPEWHWKKIDGKTLPFSPDLLLGIQQAARITHTFFPNGDDKLYVQFTIQPYQVDDIFQQIKLSINDKTFLNDANNPTTPHTFAWPSENRINNTVIQLAEPGGVSSQSYPGMWGFFKLINQSYDSVISKKEVVINLSKNKDSAKYAVFTNGPNNPFLSLNLNYFHLPDHLV